MVRTDITEKWGIPVVASKKQVGMNAWKVQDVREDYSRDRCHQYQKAISVFRDM
jgi:hypothetical protein